MDTASAPSSTPGSRRGAGFELRLERGGASVRLADQTIVPGLRLESLTLQLTDVKPPFDAGQGAGQFRHRLSDLAELSVVAEPSLAADALAFLDLAPFGIEGVRLAPREGFLEIAGRLSGGPPFTLAAGFLPRGDQGVALVFHSPRVLGPSAVPAAALPHLARAVLAELGEERLPPEPLAPLLRRILAGRAWKLPRWVEARVARAEIAGGVARLAWERAAKGTAAARVPPELLAADEGARSFREPEALTAGGDYAGARDAWIAAGAAAEGNPFAAERLLSLLVVEEKTHDRALELAGEWLLRKPGFPPALAAEAAVRLLRGEERRAARALSALAQGAAARGEVFGALLAAEAAFTLAGAAREDALPAIDAALALQRDHVPALRALRDVSRTAGDEEGLLRASRGLVAYDPDPASSARAHAEIGELLLGADARAAREHLDEALRLTPDDVEALTALSKACAAAGEPLHAVSAIDRLRELHLARGERAAAARAAAEAGALWEGALGDRDNALARYREAAELAPGVEAHARAARAAERAEQWAEAAHRHAAVLAALDLAEPGAAVVAVRTRVALADVAEAHLGDAEAAVVHLEEAAALAPGDAALLARLADMERRLGRTAGLVSALDRLAALEADPAARAALLAEAGDGALALGQTGDARGRFAAAISADPACRPALLGLSRLARERSDALAEREALLRLVPLVSEPAELADVHDRIAGAYERAGDLAGALAAAEEARRAAPSAARLDTSLRLARRSARPAEIAALLEERTRAALAAGDPALATELLLERASVVAPTDPALALATLTEARAVSPGDAAVLRAQAELAGRTGDPRLALGCLHMLLAASPADAPALELAAARAAVAAGETAAAREHAERALDGGETAAADLLDALLEQAGDDAARAEVLARVGRHLEAAPLFERAGDPSRARAALERAAEDPALAPQALPRLADLQLAEGDRPAASRALLALSRLVPGRGGARLALRAHAVGRDPAALDVAAERDPTFAPARAARARLRAADDPAAALADAEAALAGEGLEDDERDALLVLAARVAAAAGDGAAARRHLGAYCEAHPDDDGALSRLAALHRAAGARRELAEVLARRLPLTSGAEGVAVRVELSDLVAEEDPAAGARLALEALALDPSSFPALRALATPPRAAHVPPAQRAAILSRLAERAGTPEEAAAAHAMRARLLAESGDTRGALEAARTAARVGVEDDAALELRADLERRAGDAAEAARALRARAERAAERGEPDAPARLVEAGLAALAAGDRGGEEALLRALRLAPDRESARLAFEALAARARIRQDAAAERDALAALVPLLPTRARPAVLLRSASLALAAGETGAARASAEAARALAPRHAGAVEACRAAAAAEGDLAAVAELLGVLAEVEPAEAGARLLERARLLASLGDDDAADDAYGAALGALPPARRLADEHARHRRERLGGRGAAAPLEAFAGRVADRLEAAHALRVAAAAALQAGEAGTALRCARRAYARTQDDLAFAAPLLARILYLRGGGAEALVLHRRLLDAGLPAVAPEDQVVLCRQTAELADDAGDAALARRAYDRLLGIRPQDLDAALRRFELEPDRGRAVRELVDAADACRSQRQRVLALVRAADAALREADARDLGERLFRRARQDAARDPTLAAWIVRRQAAAIRAAEGASSPTFLKAIHDAAAAAQAAGDRAATRELLEEAVAVQRERGLFTDAARDLLHLDALAAAEGDFAESPGRLRAVSALLREAGDPAAAADVLRRAYAANPGSEETARLLDQVARGMGERGAPLRVELQSDRAARAEPGPARAAALVALADAHRAAGAPLQAEAALRAALTDVPAHGPAEEALLDLLGAEGRGADRARVLLERAEREEPGAAEALRRRAAADLASSPDPCDRALAADAWRAVVKAAPTDLEAARAAARLLLELGRRDEAIPLLAGVVRAAPSDREATKQLDGALAGRHRERAELFIAHAEEAQGEIRAARLREAARGFFAAGDDARARAVLVKAFEACPADSAAFSEALRDASSDVERTDAVLLARAGAVPAEAAACHRARADALQASGMIGRAIAAYEDARAADPADLDALGALAACIATSRGEAAARELDRQVVAAWEAAPASVGPGLEAPSRYRLGLALLRQGDAADGIAHLERAVVLAPGDARAGESWSALARGYADRGDKASALAAARARVGRASVVGPETELGAAIAEEAALVAELAVSTLRPPAAPARPRAGSGETASPPPAAPAPAEPLLDEPGRAGPPPAATADDDRDPRAAALAATERACALEDPAGRAAAWIEAAEALARAQADGGEVRDALELACDADSDSPAPWLARARLETLLGDPAAAARSLLSASIRAEGDAAARAALDAARIFEESDRYADALRAYRAALHADRGCVSEDALRAAEALAAGDASSAAELLVRLDPASLPAEQRAPHARKLARVLDAAGRGEEAGPTWLELFRASPWDVEAFSRAAAFALASGGVDGWTELATEHEEALGAAATPERRRDLRSDRGRLLAQEGRVDEARGALLAALDLDADHAPTLEALAALEERAVDLEPTTPSAPAPGEPPPEAWLALEERALDLEPATPARAAGDAAPDDAWLTLEERAPELEPATPAHAAGETPPEDAWLTLEERAPELEPATPARAAGETAPEDAWLTLEEGAPDLEPATPARAAGETPPDDAWLALETAALDPFPAGAPVQDAVPADAWVAVQEHALDLSGASGAQPEPPAGAPPPEVSELAPALPPMGSTDAEALARDGRRRMEAGDLSGAYERLSVALAREPSNLYVARDLARVAERLGLFDEYVRLGEACADAIAAEDPLAAAARYRHFAEVLRDRLGQTDRAGVMLEKALALVPDDVDTRRELVQLWGSHPDTAHRALEIWLDLARAEPSDADALAGIAEVSGRIAARAAPDVAARSGELARVAASLAAFVAPGAHLAPAPARLAAHVREDLRTRVAAPGAVGPLGRLLAVLAPWLEPLFPADLNRRGASPADGLAPDRAPKLVATFDAAARALRTRPHRMFLSNRPGAEIAVENCQPPAVVVSPGVTELPAAALAFLAARSLDLLDHGWTLVGKFAPADVGILLELACRFAGGDPAPRGLPAQRAGAFLQALEARVPAGARAEARALGAAASAELAGVDTRAFAAALRRTANRVGLLYCGDPGQALRALALLEGRQEEGPPDPRRALALPDLRDLALLSLSEPFLDLRATGVG